MAFIVPLGDLKDDQQTDLQNHAQQTLQDAQAKLTSSLADLQGHAQQTVQDIQGHASSIMAPAIADLRGFGQNLVDNISKTVTPPAPVVQPDSATQPAPDTSGEDELHQYARSAAGRAGIDPEQFIRQIQQESGFNPTAGSAAGAQGIAQIVPKYHPGVDPSDPHASLDYAANLMASHKRQYGNDTDALVAYNGGQGAVDAWHNGTPYAESQQYVDAIHPGTADGPASDIQDRRSAARPSQFGDKALTSAEAYAACGPAAAVWAATNGGKAITLREATDLAKQSGWTEDGGMNGIANEKSLLDKMGVASRLDTHVDWNAITQDAANGHPVILSTEGHYFTIDGVQDGKYHVGTSGTDLKRGSEWMSAQQIQDTMGAANGVLFVDNPSAGGQPSVAAEPTLARRGLDAIGQGLTNVKDTVDRTILSRVAPSQGNTSGPVPPTPPDHQPADLRYPQAPPWLVKPPEGSPLDRSIRQGQELTPQEQLQAAAETYQGASTSRQNAIEAANPARDVPLLGGAINMGASMAADPSTYLAGGPIKAGAERALAGSTAADAIARAGVEGAGWGTVQGVEQPNATPESIAASAGQGALFGVGLHGVGAAAPLAGRAAAAAAPHFGEFLRNEDGFITLPGGKLMDNANPEALRNAQDYTASHGLGEIPPSQYVKNDVPTQTEIARQYNAATSDPHDPAVKASYDAFKAETAQQYEFLQQRGMTFEPAPAGREPYDTSSSAMMTDVRDNHHLFVSSAGIGDNPMLTPDENFQFRAVHDYFGHAASGVGFGPRGEENAWLAHSKMYSADALPAMTTETRGQNSSVNFSPGAQDLPVAERPFAEQKATLLDPRFQSRPDAAFPRDQLSTDALDTIPDRTGASEPPRLPQPLRDQPPSASHQNPDLGASGPIGGADDAELLQRTAKALRAGTAPPSEANIEWRDSIVPKSKGRDDRVGEAIPIPHFIDSEGNATPLRTHAMGMMGSPENRAHTLAVRAMGGRRSYPNGTFTRSDGSKLSFDSPQELAVMSHLTDQAARGEIQAWWPASQTDVAHIEFINTHPDKFGYNTLDSDFLVQHSDGSLEVQEVKAAKVIATSEEWGKSQLDPVTGKLGWHVTKKAIGAIPYLAERGVGYRLVTESTTSKLLNPTRISADGKPIGRTFAGLTGVDPRDVPELDKGLGNMSDNSAQPYSRVVDRINEVSKQAVEMARAGATHAELTRFVRDNLLATAETVGRTGGPTRLVDATMAVNAGLTSGTGTKLSRDGLAEHWPEAAGILNTAPQRGVKITGVSADAQARSIYAEMTGDPAGIELVAAELGKMAGTRDTKVFYPDTHPEAPGSPASWLRTLHVQAPGDAVEAALAGVQRRFNTIHETVVVGYNTDHSLATIHVVSRDAEQSAARAHELKQALDANGISSEIGDGTQVHFTDLTQSWRQAGYDTAIARRKELLGESAIGSAYPRAVPRIPSESPRSARKGSSAAAPTAAEGDPSLRGWDANDRTPENWATDAFPVGGGSDELTPLPSGGSIRKLNPQEVRKTEGLDEMAALRASAPDAAGKDPSPIPGGVRQLADPANRIPEGARPIELSDAEEVQRLRLDKFPPEVRDTLEANARSVDWGWQQRRGIIPDAVAEREAQRLAADTTFDQWIRNGKAGKAYSTEEIRAIRNASAQQASVVGQAARDIGGGKDDSATLARFFTEGAKLNELTKLREGARAEAGRSLRAWQDPASLVGLSPNDAIARISKALGGDRERLLQVVKEYQAMVDQGAGPVQMSEFWARLTKPPVGAWDWIKALRYNSMISGVTTIGRVATGGLLENLYGLARDSALSPMSIPAMMRGEWVGVMKGVSTFGQTVAHGITEDAALRGDLPQGIQGRLSNPAAKTAAFALELPARSHQAIQDVAFQGRYGARLYGRAAEQVASEKLSGKAAAARMDELVDKPTDAMQADAMQAGQGASFRSPTGEFGQAISKLGSTVPGHFAVPFTRIPYNIAARGIDRTPLGLLGTLVDVIRTGGKYVGMDAEEAANVKGWTGKGPGGLRPFKERLADNVIGSTAMLWFYQQATQGNITSEGPDSQDERDQLWAQGWRPHSVKFGDHYVPMQMFGAWALPMALAAGIAEAQKYHKDKAIGPQPDELMDAVRRSSSLLKQETYLRGVGDIINGISNPARYGSSFAASTAESAIPYGAAINNLATTGDSIARRGDSGDIGAAIRSRIPGDLHSSVQTDLGPLGDPLPNDRQGVRAFAPAAWSDVKADPTLQLLGDYGVTVPQPEKIATSANGLSEVALTPDEQRQIQQSAGSLIKDFVLQDQSRPEWAAPPPSYSGSLQAYRRGMLQIAVAKARGAASSQFISQMPPADFKARAVAAHTARVSVANSSDETKPALPRP